MAAEDIVQNGCLRAVQRREQFEVANCLHHWLMTIVRSIWLNEQRAGNLRKRDALLVAEQQG